MPTIAQVEEMERVLEFIEAHQENWEQRFWVSDDSSVVQSPESALECGTACCFAGWAALLAGERLVHGWRVDQMYRNEDGLLCDITIPQWASEHLGLPGFDGDPDGAHLFKTTNTLDDLRLQVKQYRVDAEALLPEGPTS